NERALVDAAALFVGANVMTLMLVACAPRLGLVDDASDARDRKHHERPVPLVGGVVIALSLLAWVSLRGVGVVGGALCAGIAFDPRAVLAAAALAFLTGLIDDLSPRGLGPVSKVLGQTAAGIALALGLLIDGQHAPLWACAVAVFAAVVAQNSAN